MEAKWAHSFSSLTLTKNGVVSDVIPHPNAVKTWEDTMSKWPRVTYGKICSYFFDSLAIDGNAMANLRSSEDYLYLHSNKVGCVLTYKHANFVYLKANVEPSQCVNDSWHSAWVVVTEAGDVETAGCSCVAGPGRSCSHAAAVLWKVENAVRQGKAGLACTDGQNQWNTGRKRNAGQHKMQDMRFKRHKRQRLYQPSTSQSSSAIPTPAHEARLFNTHEEWRKTALASPLADFFTSPHESLLQLSFDADPSAQCVEKAPSPLLLPTALQSESQLTRSRRL